MRVFPWLLTLALAVECLAGSLLARFVMRSIADERRAPPGFTLWFFDHPVWWLCLPLPWIVYAFVLTRRSAPTADAIMVFTGTVAIVGAFLLGVMLIASILPLLTFRV